MLGLFHKLTEGRTQRPRTWCLRPEFLMGNGYESTSAPRVSPSFQKLRKMLSPTWWRWAQCRDAAPAAGMGREQLSCACACACQREPRPRLPARIKSLPRGLTGDPRASSRISAFSDWRRMLPFAPQRTSGAFFGLQALWAGGPLSGRRGKVSDRFKGKKFTSAIVLKRNFRKGSQKHKRRNSHRTYLCCLQVYRKPSTFYRTQVSKIVYGLNEATASQFGHKFPKQNL